MRTIGHILLLAWLLSASTACRSVYPDQSMSRSFNGTSAEHSANRASSNSPAVDESLPSEATTIWPGRWGFEQITPSTAVGVIAPLVHPISELRKAHLSRFHTLRTGETEYADMSLLAQGLQIDRPYQFKPEGPGSYVFVHRPPVNESEPDQDSKSDSNDEPDLAFKFISAQIAGLSKTGDELQEQLELERTWFTYRKPTKDRKPIGTILLMPGMFGTPEGVIDGMERYFRSQRWSVLRMLSHPSRFTQRQQYAVPEGSDAAVASEIASYFDTRAAEAAYAASSALRYVHEQFPDQESKPVVLLGMSGGAMILPTVYMYDPDLYDAGILIAGGGNFLEINVRSNYAAWIDAIDLDADPSDLEVQKLEKPRLKALTQMYLDRSKLDSLHTAASMHDVPVLMLHASADKAVPASTGDALYEALGSPERWVYPVGHELIFAGLPLQTAKIEKWMRAQVIESEKLND
ncbi:MAG: hypothetical protein JJ974_02210 [Phycisphaerales bacterium]|nr:hypothetical protein [Phycisphaerales bacterium]